VLGAGAPAPTPTAPDGCPWYIGLLVVGEVSIFAGTGEERLDAIHDATLAVQSSAREPEIEGSQSTNILELLVLDELHHDVLLRLDLQHLQRETEELGGLDVATVDAADETQLHGLVHQQFRREGKALLLPVFGVVDPRADDLLDEVLRIGAVHVFGLFHRAVGHFRSVPVSLSNVRALRLVGPAIRDFYFRQEVKMWKCTGFIYIFFGVSS